MKYVNGGDIFPESLLRQIQRYASGQLVYIPARAEKRGWGETSGYKQFLKERNNAIREEYACGADMDGLAEKYGLSWDTIRKIIYAKKEGTEMEYRCSLSSAKSFAQAGRLEEWVHSYLLSDGHNKEFSDGLKLLERRYFGPVEMPLELFERCCGPEAHMKFRVDKVWFEKHVAELTEAVWANRDMPPLIAHYVDDGFELNDGNHRFEACRRLGIKAYPFIIWITEEDECREFIEKYGRFLQA